MVGSWTEVREEIFMASAKAAETESQRIHREAELSPCSIRIVITYSIEISSFTAQDVGVLMRTKALTYLSLAQNPVVDFIVMRRSKIQGVCVANATQVPVFPVG